jgi:hypothetical protein
MNVKKIYVVWCSVFEILNRFFIFLILTVVLSAENFDLKELGTVEIEEAKFSGE